MKTVGAKVFFLMIFLGVLAGKGMAVEQREMRCPTGIGSMEGAAPSMIVKAANDFTLIVCGGEVAPEEPHSEFEVYSVDSSGQRSGSLYTASALEPRLLADEKQMLVVDELYIPDLADAKPIALFRIRIACSLGGCKRSEPICLYKPTKVKGREDAVKKLQEYMTGSKKGQIPEDTLIQALGDQALHGNKGAQEIIELCPEELALDGHSAELFSQFKNIMTDLRRNRCL